MREVPPSNSHAGVPVAQSTNDAGAVSGGRDPGRHYEADADQIVTVVHEVRPETIPTQGPTDIEERGAADPATMTDVAVATDPTSVHEARPQGGDRP